MAKPVILGTLISAALFCWSDGVVNADLMSREIRLPKDCPRFLKVTSKPAQEGLIGFVIRIQPEEATNAGDLYRGRVGTAGHLKLSSADALLGAIQVHESSEKSPDKSSDGGIAEFRFELVSQVAKHSTFTINASLFEKNGRPTLGGGKTYRIHLDGFLPGESPH